MLPYTAVRAGASHVEDATGDVFTIASTLIKTHV
jgi:hypothetical protein